MNYTHIIGHDKITLTYLKVTAKDDFKFQSLSIYHHLFVLYQVVHVIHNRFQTFLQAVITFCTFYSCKSMITYQLVVNDTIDIHVLTCTS